MDVKLLPVSEVNSLSIWGQGTMGRTWTLAALMGGFEVWAHEPNSDTEASAMEFIDSVLRKAEKKKEQPGYADEMLRRLKLVSSNELIESDTPIHLEVIPENMRLKLDFFKGLDLQLLENTVLWTNTSCLNVEQMAIASGHPELFVGTHGMNPVHMMAGVEVVRTNLVDETVFDWTMEVLKKMGKTPFPAINVPGFIVNKVYVPLALDCIRLLFRREADIATVDKALQLSLGHPQGAFLLADRIGHDVMIDVANALHAATQDPRFVVPVEYLAMRKAGLLGSKSGKGFYNWTDPKNPVPVPLEELLAL